MAMRTGKSSKFGVMMSRRNISSADSMASLPSSPAKSSTSDLTVSLEVYDRNDDGSCGRCFALVNVHSNICVSCGAKLKAGRAGSAPLAQHTNKSSSSGAEQLFLAFNGSDQMSRVREQLTNDIMRASIEGSVLTRGSSALSSAKVVAIEKELGKELPLSDDGNYVVITKGDIGRLRDSETLAFLEQMSPFFVKYFDADAASTQNGGEPVPSTPGTNRSATDNVFITAVDCKGAEFKVQLSQDQTLLVPVLPEQCSTPSSTNKDDLLTNDAEAADDLELLRNPCLLTEADLSEFDLYKALDLSIDDVMCDEVEEECVDSSSTTGLGEATTTENKSEPHHGGKKKLTKIDMIVNGKTSKEKPRYMQNTNAAVSKRRDLLKEKEEKIQVLPEEKKPPPPNNIPTPPKMAKPVVLKPKKEETPTVAVKPQHYVLTPEEERRVEELLALSEDAVKHLGTIDDDTVDFGSSSIGYSDISVPHYVFVDAETRQKLAAIDAQLDVCRSARTAVEDRSSIAEREDHVVSNAEPNSSGNELRRSQNTQKADAVAPSENGGQEQQELMKRKKAKDEANQQLQNFRAERGQRKRLSEIHEKLESLHSEFDQLFSPPFCFNFQFDMEGDPRGWQWPADVPQLQESDIQRLIDEARKETNVFLRLKASTPAMNDVVPPSCGSPTLETGLLKLTTGVPQAEHSNPTSHR